ncbi:hypothetical protein PR048_032785 [Dryococelus australis]|uniref:Uncharacterized protein n=1 Tax=Dryococelus australis TaxID=614101 RepID=A0ABQ9G6C7_9NEOP|nr:hypothetical protein PR048_032785 [Dryococelus australis]
MSVAAASRQHTIPSRTLRDWLKIGDRTPKLKLGCNAVLSADIGEELKTRVIRLQQVSYENGIFHPFSNNKAGKDWFYGFTRRNNDIVVRKAENLSYGRLLTYKCSQLVLAGKGCKRVHGATRGEKDETVTVVARTNATSTNWIPPILLYKDMHSKNGFGDYLPNGNVFTMTPKGYITKEEFVIPSFTLIRTEYREKLCSYLMVTKSHLDNSVHDVAEGLGLQILSWAQAAAPKNAMSALRSTGIFPFNPQVIPETAFVPRDVPDRTTLQARPTSSSVNFLHFGDIHDTSNT